MKILVTGGTGFVGRHLVHSLVEKGEFVRMLVRKTSDVEEFNKLGVEVIHGDISDGNSLQGAVKDINIVYHLAAQVGKWGIPDKQFYAINVQGTLNLLEASLHTGVEQFVFCSTPGVQGKGCSQAKETLPYNPPYIYERTKCEAEKLVLYFHHNRKLPATIMRPDFVYGPGDLRRLSLYRSIRDKKFRIVGNGKSYLHPTYIDDIIQGFHLVLNNPVAFGEIYNLAGPGLITVKEYVRTIARILKVSCPRFKIPKPLAVTAAWAFEAFSMLNGKEPFISTSKIGFLTNSHGSDISKARNQLGYKPEFVFRDGMRHTINWYYENCLL